MDQFKMRSLFDSLDTRRNGYITLAVSWKSTQELEDYLQTHRITHLKSGDILDECDIDQDGKIDYQEFHTFMNRVGHKSEREPTLDEVRQVFEMMDHDGNQLISFRQFWKECRKYQSSLSKEQAKQLFDDIDRDHNNYIDFGEFVEYLDFDGPQKNN